MNVYAYAETPAALQLNADAPQWSAEWSRAGFAPRILFASDARIHPEYARLSAVFSAYPNGVAFTRWLALRVAATQHPPGRALLFADFSVSCSPSTDATRFPGTAVERSGVAFVHGVDAFLATLTGINRALAAFGNGDLALRVAKSGEFTPAAFLAAAVHRPDSIVVDGLSVRSKTTCHRDPVVVP
jgi:hypothetical protein